MKAATEERSLFQEELEDVVRSMTGMKMRVSRDPGADGWDDYAGRTQPDYEPYLAGGTI